MKVKFLFFIYNISSKSFVKVFSSEDHKTMSLFDKSDLYFYDYNMAGLFVQENYLSCTPQVYRLLFIQIMKNSW